MLKARFRWPTKDAGGPAGRTDSLGFESDETTVASLQFKNEQHGDSISCMRSLILRQHWRRRNCEIITMPDDIGGRIHQLIVSTNAILATARTSPFVLTSQRFHE